MPILLLLSVFGCGLLTMPVQAVQEISPAAVGEAVGRFVQAQLEGELEPGERVETRTRWRVPILVDREGRVHLEISRLSSRPLQGPTVLRLRVRVDDRVASDMSVTADVRWLRPVLVAVRGMRRGEKLTADLVELKERDITQVRGQYYTGPQQVAGLRMHRSVRGGEVLTDRYTEPIPVVARGASVQLVVETANLRISAEAVALENGGIGDRIRVRNVDSGSVVYGRVVDAGCVRVEIR